MKLGHDAKAYRSRLLIPWLGVVQRDEAAVFGDLECYN